MPSFRDWPIGVKLTIYFPPFVKGAFRPHRQPEVPTTKAIGLMLTAMGPGLKRSPNLPTAAGCSIIRPCPIWRPFLAAVLGPLGGEVGVNGSGWVGNFSSRAEP